MRRRRWTHRETFPSAYKYPTRLALLFVALTVVGPHSAWAESVFTLDEVINLRSFFGDGGVLIDEEEPRFEWAGPVALDAADGLLYVAGPDGLGIIDEANLRPLAWVERTDTGRTPVIGLRGIAAMAVQPATGDLYVYRCTPCRDENVGARFDAVAPRAPFAKSVRRFEPLRTPEGSPIIIDEMAFDAEGNLFLFQGASSILTNPVTGEFDPRVFLPREAHSTGGAAFDPMTGHLFALGSNNVLAEVDPLSGDLLSLTDLDEFLRFPSTRARLRRGSGMVFSPSGDKLYITADSDLLEDTVSNGKLVVLNRTVVPEPATLALLLSGALGMLTCLHRRRRS